jgi:hypothetical protein
MFASNCLKRYIELAVTTVSGRLFQHFKHRFYHCAKHLRASHTMHKPLLVGLR